MAGIVVFAVYLLVGILLSQLLLADKSPLIRGWIGLSLGFVLFMWLPVLFAFFFAFTLLAECLALLLLLLLAAGAFAYRRRHPAALRGLSPGDRRMAVALLCFVLPMAAFMAYLQHTHTLREVDGALHVGQATYGDLAMHLSIIMGLRGASLPTHYAMLPSQTLGYPMLTDAMSTSMVLLGTSVRLSMIIPSVAMSALVYAGFLLLAKEMTGRTSAAVLAGVLLFFNGGLGFLYHFDLAGQNLGKITEIFTGWYKTPPNQPDLNLRWSNLVVDMLLPQRTFLGGWVLLLPGLYFAREAFRSGKRRPFLLAALFGAALPLVHTHSFMALALYSAGGLLYTLCFGKDKAKRKQTIVGAAYYLLIVAALALPQLVFFTFRQAASNGFLKLHFNWVNNTGNGLIDFYPWFWLKNIGLPLIAMVCALLDYRKNDRMDAIGAALIFIVAETVLFQPLDYDNNKLFYVWYLLMLPMASSWCLAVWDRLRGRRSRVLLAALFIAGSTLSGALSMAREAVSDYQMYSAEDVDLAAYIDSHTPTDAVFITGWRHENPVYTLAGRDIVCGPSNFMWTHGFMDEFSARSSDVRAFYEDPENNLDILEKYDVSYILISWRETYEMTPDWETIAALFTPMFEEGMTALYAVHNDV